MKITFFERAEEFKEKAERFDLKHNVLPGVAIAIFAGLGVGSYLYGTLDLKHSDFNQNLKDNIKEKIESFKDKEDTNNIDEDTIIENDEIVVRTR